MADPLGLHAQYILPPPGRNVGWAAAAGFDSFPDTQKTITFFKLHNKCIYIILITLNGHVS